MSPREIVDQQAEDMGLWFSAQTAPEAYLQHELRRLHAAIEAEQSPRNPPVPQSAPAGGRECLVGFLHGKPEVVWRGADAPDKGRFGWEWVHMVESTPVVMEREARTVSPFSKYAHAPWLEPVPVSGVNLRKLGDRTIVEIYLDGEKKEAIREFSDNHFDHYISAEGIRGLFGKGEAPGKIEGGLAAPGREALFRAGWDSATAYVNAGYTGEGEVVEYPEALAKALESPQPIGHHCPSIEGQDIKRERADCVLCEDSQPTGEADLTDNAGAEAEGYQDAMHRHVVRTMAKWWPYGIRAFTEAEAKACLDLWDIGKRRPKAPSPALVGAGEALEAAYREGFYEGAKSQGWSDSSGCDSSIARDLDEAWEKSPSLLYANGWQNTGSIGPYLWTRNDQDFYTLEQALEIHNDSNQKGLPND